MRLPIRSLSACALAALAAPLLGGCSSDFWDRSPRVAAQMERAPGACAPPAATYADAPSGVVQPPAATDAPSSYAMPPPEVVRQEPPRSYADPSSAGPTDEDQMVLEGVNRIRHGRGLRPLAFEPRLYLAAKDHSLEQARHGYMGHDSPDPERATVVQRIHQAGYQGTLYAEVVAWGYRDVPEVVEGWMNSREHREVLMDANLTQAGFSRAGDYWTGNFGTPMAMVPSTSYAPRRSSSPALPDRAAPGLPPTTTPRATAPRLEPPSAPRGVTAPSRQPTPVPVLPEAPKRPKKTADVGG